MKRIAASLLAAYVILGQPGNTPAMEFWGNGSLANSTGSQGFDFTKTTQDDISQIAAPFNTGSDPNYLTILSASLLLGSTTGPATVNVSLYSYTGTNPMGPNAVVSPGYVAQGINVPQLGVTTSQWITATFPNPIALSPNTNYFLVLERDGPSNNLDWKVPITNVDYSDLNSGSGYGIGIVLIYSATGSVWTAETNTKVAYQLTGVPEPSTYVFGAIGSLVLGLCLRRKASKPA